MPILTLYFPEKFVRQPHLILPENSTPVEHIQYNHHNKLIASIGSDSTIKVGTHVPKTRTFINAAFLLFQIWSTLPFKIPEDSL